MNCVGEQNENLHSIVMGNVVEWERKRGAFMVKEYIEQKKEKTEAQILENRKKLKVLEETEKLICGKIERIRQSDIDFEIFSPRTGEMSLREEIHELEQKLRQIRIEKVNMQEMLDELLIKKKNFEIMLKELEECFT